MTDRKVALITGSGTGVGAATALLLAQQGYHIVINYSRSEVEAKASQAACEAAGLGPSDGRDFGWPGFIRLNTACPTERLAEAMRRLRQAFTEGLSGAP